MSLNPDWFSTVYGALIATSQACAALAFIIVVVAYLGQQSPFAELVSEGRVSDLGRLLLTAVIFWVYMAFVQFLIIWSGNLPEEVVWYVQRFHGGWSWLAAVILFLHAIIPFFLLLSNDLKRNRSRLAGVALMIFVADLLYLFWIVEPVFSAEHFTVHWLDIETPIFVGGLWITAFSWRLRRRIPPQSPAQAEGVEVVDSAG
jgi:hypothetical protein